ncbi:G-protein coupled receptor 143-like [Acipenser ruthenus]|uniref:G-protein coupled receptor 143-like n=1 Tax=Acipenser ruthenus TaxID=7906 RepID=UPI00274235A4|nr:G-protein coupled receptor 143-like [Acipenser ruthenus]XP_058856875.1 G-protein coupled receptor 143-like [Acipenser ruthenus]
MASPRFQSFCCFQDAASAGLVSLNTAAYHRLSVACAFLSLIGVGVHNLPRLWSEYRRRRLKRADPPRPGSQDRVAFIITACNFVGCAGILVRSAVWLSFIQQALPREQTVWLGSFCVLSSLWIQFFLQGAQVWWTLFYAIEVYRQVQEPTTPRSMILYHVLSWGLSAIICVPGLSLLFQTPVSSCERNLKYAIPHYLATYLPLLLVLLANPPLLSRTLASVSTLLKQQSGSYTASERLQMKNIRQRFLKIMVAFTVCWLPNVLSEALLLLIDTDLAWSSAPSQALRSAALTTWVLTAVLNPMYAFLQSLAFHKWTGCGLDVCTWGLYCKVEQCCCRGKGEEEEGETESESEVTMENILKPQSMVGHWDSLNRQVQQPASQSGCSSSDVEGKALWLVTACCSKSALLAAERQLSAQRTRALTGLKA